MIISVELSYYPLLNTFNPVISEFISKLKNRQGLTVETGPMSTLLVGEYDLVFDVLSREIKTFMEQYPSVFMLKVANACPI